MKKKQQQQQQQNTEEIDLMSIKLKLIQNLGLTYIQASKVIKHIKDDMEMNEETVDVDECDWIEEMIEIKNNIIITICLLLFIVCLLTI